MRRLAGDEVVLPAQALGELYLVLTRKAGRPAERAKSAILGWADAFPVLATTQAVVFEAMDVAESHRLGFWDSVMLAVAAQAQFRMLLSEDMQDGLTWRGVTIRDPFATPFLPRP